jgi:hypothetical protein
VNESFGIEIKDYTDLSKSRKSIADDCCQLFDRALPGTTSITQGVHNWWLRMLRGSPECPALPDEAFRVADTHDVVY